MCIADAEQRCRLQVTQAIQLHITSSDSPAAKLALCLREPVTFRARLREHVVVMKPLGFNAHALGLIAVRNLHVLLASPQDLAAHIAMLRDVLGPRADELADVGGQTGITAACLPAVMPFARSASTASEAELSISRLHKACLFGTTAVMQYTRWGLEELLRNLVEAGVFADEGEAKRACMQDPVFLKKRTLHWLLHRKAAVHEAGGAQTELQTVCRATHSRVQVLKMLMLWQCARCACT